MNTYDGPVVTDMKFYRDWTGPISAERSVVLNNGDQQVSAVAYDGTTIQQDVYLVYVPTTTVGDYTVSVDWGNDPNIPAGAKVSGSVIDSNDETYSNDISAVSEARKSEGTNTDDLKFQALDLSIADAYGNQYEPSKKVNVKVSLDSSEFEDIDPSSLEIHHIVDGKAIEVADSTGSNGHGKIGVADNKIIAEFNTDSFSDYIISGKFSRNGVDLTVNHNHIEVKFVTWDYDLNDNPGVVQNVKFDVMPASNESDNLKSQFVSSEGNSTPEYVVLFTKPEDGYIITSATQNVTGYDGYNFGGNVTSTYNGEMYFYNYDTGPTTGNTWHGFHDDGGVKETYGSGYYFYNGYTLTSHSFQGSITLTAEPINLRMNASASTGNTELKAGDETTFTINVDPDLADNVVVSNINSFNVTINGKSYPVTLNKQSVKQEDGSTKDLYVGTVENYEVTADDVRNGSVELNASAEFEYTSTFEITKPNGEGKTTHTNTATASASTSENVPITKFMNLQIAKQVDSDGEENQAETYANTANQDFGFNISLKDNNNNPITGTFNYYENNSSDPKSMSFDANGSASFNLKDNSAITLQLPNGSNYTVTEDKQNDPYELKNIGTSEGSNATISENSVTGNLLSAVAISYTNKLKSGSVFFHKKGEKVDGTTDYLNGSEFTLYSSSDCNDSSIVTTSTDISNSDHPNEEQDPGSLGFVDIPVGTYYMKETVAPDDYQLDPTIYTVTISENNSDGSSTSTITDSNDKTVTEITDKLIRKDITVKKVTGDWNSTQTGLTGAEFTLNINTGTSESPEWTAAKDQPKNGGTSVLTNGNLTVSNANGLTIEQLPVGTYQLTETKAPDGYLIKSKPIEFTITKDGISFENTDYVHVNNNVITVKNDPGTSLPVTGGPGTKLIYSLGAGLVAAGIALYLNKRKKA